MCIQAISISTDNQYLNFLNNCIADKLHPPLRFYEDDNFMFINGNDSKQASISKVGFSVRIDGTLYTDQDLARRQLLFDIEKVNKSIIGGTSGFVDYSNAIAPYAIVADTWTDITNDGLGGNTNKNFLPSGVTELMDVLTGYFDFTELTLGDTVFIRNDFQIVPNTNNALLELRFTLGTGVGSYVLQKRLDRLDSGSGVPYPFALGSDLIYIGDSNTRDNPVKLQIRLSTTGIFTNFGSVINVIKR